MTEVLERPDQAKKKAEAKLNHDAMAFWPLIHDQYYTLRGFPVGDLLSLNPNGKPKRLLELRIHPGTGKWAMHGAPASGEDLADLISYTADTTRERAIEFLEDLVRRERAR